MLFLANCWWQLFTFRHNKLSSASLHQRGDFSGQDHTVRRKYNFCRLVDIMESKNALDRVFYG